jgi:hypothetical protein
VSGRVTGHTQASASQPFTTAVEPPSQSLSNLASRSVHCLASDAAVVTKIQSSGRSETSVGRGPMPRTKQTLSDWTRSGGLTIADELRLEGRSADRRGRGTLSLSRGDPACPCLFAEPLLSIDFRNSAPGHHMCLFLSLANKTNYRKIRELASFCKNQRLHRRAILLQRTTRSLESTQAERGVKSRACRPRIGQGCHLFYRSEKNCALRVGRV